MQRFSVTTIVFALCVMFAILYSCRGYAQSTTQDQEEIKIERIERMLGEIPDYPHSEDAESSYQSDEDYQEVDNYFYSNSSYDEVRAFYSRRLEKKRWILVEEETIGDIKRLVFRKGEYSATISFLGVSSNKKFKYGIMVRHNENGSGINNRRRT